MVFMSRHNGFMGLGGIGARRGDPEPSSYDQFVSALAADGGWFWDLTRADALFQDRGGSVPASALDNPVGAAFSVEHGMAATGSALTHLTRQTSGTVTDNGNGTWTLSSSAWLRFNFDLSQLVQGALYEISFTTFDLTGTAIPDFCDIEAAQVVGPRSGAFTFRAQRATYDSTYRYVDVLAGGGSSVTISAPTIRQISATSLIQATSANRPLFKQGAGALFDGSNDGLASAIGIDLTGTNKIMVGAAIRKLSDSAFGMLAEHSATASSNNGSFYVAAPLNNTGTRFRWLSKGTTQQVVDLTDAGLAAPVSAVVSGVGDIGSNIARAFVNGAQAGENTSSQGTGNFGNYTFYVGRRGGASNPYNGYVAGLYLIPYIDNDLRTLADAVMAQLAQGLPS